MKNRIYYLLLFFCISFFIACSSQKVVPEIKLNNSPSLLERKVIPNSLLKLKMALSAKEISFRSTNRLMLVLSNEKSRRDLANRSDIPEALLLQQYELYQLQQIGIPEEAAQILWHAQFNQHNSFTGERLNPEILINLDPENLWIDVLGWQAGHSQDLAANYNISLEDITSWQNMIHF